MTRRRAPAPSRSRGTTPRAERPQLTQSVCDRLARAIVAGAFEPGQKISEPTLSTMLGVSRAPIREALIELELRGMVEFDERGRTRVPTLTRDDLKEILAVRTALDPLAARLAAEQRDPDGLLAMERNLAATAEATTLAELSRLDTEFHGLIIRGADNRRLEACWHVLEHQVELWIAQMQRQREGVCPDTHDRTVATHREIFEVIRAGRGAEAETLARRHLEGWQETMSFLR